MIDNEDQASIAKEFDGRYVGDSRHRFKTGDIGFLLELTPEHGSKRVELRDSPVRTAGSLVEVLFGMVTGGRTNVEALGVAKVVSVTPNGRGKIETLWGPALDVALEELGYPQIDRNPYVQ